MSTQTVEAVYEQGAFRPVTPLPGPLREGQRVRLLVESVAEGKGYLELVTHVLDGLSESEIDAIEALATRREDFFDPGAAPQG